MKFLRPFRLIRVLWGALWTNAFGLLSGWNRGHRLPWSLITACYSSFWGITLVASIFLGTTRVMINFQERRLTFTHISTTLGHTKVCPPSPPSRLYLSREDRPLAMMVSIMHLDFAFCLVVSVQAPNSSRYRLALKLIFIPCMAPGMSGGPSQVLRIRHINFPSFKIDRDWQRTNSTLIQLPRTNWQIRDFHTLEGSVSDQ